jgi:hypothetical protein
MITLSSMVLQSLPLCLVVSLTMVALEVDDTRTYLRRSAIHFLQLYGGIIMFGLVCHSLDVWLR